MKRLIKSIDDDLNVIVHGEKYPLVEFALHPKGKGPLPLSASPSHIDCPNCGNDTTTYQIIFDNGDLVGICKGCAFMGFIENYLGMREERMRNKFEEDEA